MLSGNSAIPEISDSPLLTKPFGCILRFGTVIATTRNEPPFFRDQIEGESMLHQAPANPLPPILVRAREGLLLHQTLYVAAKLGVADELEDGGWRSAAELARQLEVNEDALYRTLRLLASQGVFEENNTRRFRNNEVCNFLRTGVPRSIRSLFLYLGSDFHYPSFGQIMHSVKTGESSRTMLSGTNGFEHLRR
jgi:hypothetical protein